MQKSLFAIFAATMVLSSGVPTLGPIRLGTSRIASTGDTIPRFSRAA